MSFVMTSLVQTCTHILLFSILTIVSSVDVKPQKEPYKPDYRIYHNLTSILSTLDKLVVENKKYIKYHYTFVSRQGQNQGLIRVTGPTRDNDIQQRRVKLLLSFGEHAREFVPVESLFFLLKRIVNNETFMNELDIYIIVLANPDGRQFVEKTQNYCWRGTSNGVDINRNFDWEFGGKGSSSDKTDEEYRGTRAFSEPECKVYTSITEEVQFDAFLSLHSGIRQIYIPYADTKSRVTGRDPDNLDEMMRLGKLLATSTKHTYQYGEAASLNDYTADGTVFDYMAGVRKIPFSYAIELWGQDNYKGSSCFNLFNPPSDQLQTVIEELYPLYTTLFDYLIQWKRRQGHGDIDYNITMLEQGDSKAGYIHTDLSMPQNRENKHEDIPSLTPGFVLLCCVILLTFLVAIHGKYPVCRRMYQRRRVVSLRALSSTFSTSFFH